MILLDKNKRYLITDSATQGLYLLFNSIRISTSVILHPNTCLHVYMAALHARKKVHFVDIETKSCNYNKVDLRKKIESIKEKEKHPPIVVIVHLYGITCPLDIIDVCNKQDAIIIEDCAQALFSLYSDKSAVGSKGDFSVFSFGDTKHLNLGSTGAIVFNNESAYQKLENSLKNLKLIKSIRNINQNENYKSDYYSLMKDKISHEVKQNKKGDFRDFLQYYSKIFSEGITQNKFNIVEIKKMILEIKNSNSNIIFKENLIESRLNKYPFRLFERKSEYIYWRFSFLVNPKDRKKIISSIRKKYPYLSTWYPSIPQMINYKLSNNFNGSKELANSICNIDSINLTISKLTKILDLIEDFYA